MVHTNVDITFCIDGTGSMDDLIETVKNNAKTFHSRLEDELAKANREVETLRVSVIVFRDLKHEGKDAFQIMPFVELPQETRKFENFVNDITATGGGDAPESSLEALSLAMQSDWNTEGEKKRHIIVLWTDAPNRPIEGPCNIYQGLPSSMKEFRSWWMDPQESKMNNTAKRMVLFVPNDPTWDEFEDWDMVTIQRSDELGLSDINMDLIYEMLVGTIA